MIKPTIVETKELAKKFKTVPVAMQMFADIKTSMQVLKGIKQKSNQFFMLESVKNSDTWGRYTFLGFDPKLKIKGKDGVNEINNGGKITRETASPQQTIRKILEEYKSPRLSYLPPFTGGFVGYFSYESIKYFEPSLKLTATDEYDFADFELMLFDKVIAFDHFAQKIFLIANIKTDNVEANYAKAVLALKDMEKLILDESPKEEVKAVCGEFKPAFTQEEYSVVVDKAKHYIKEGDIFQVVPSNRLSADFEGSLLPVYRNLRTMNPSPYMVYFHFDDLEIAGASPETLVSLKNGELSTYPLAGTVPRGKTEEEDKKLTEELLKNEKELAEHDMLVDLGRNDLGKISKFGTVKVAEYQKIKQFSHVSHIASRVTSVAAEGKDALDAIAAVLPAGTLSGAPKKRACEIIDELEKTRRGPYGGALGYIDFTGNMDMCIGIRMAVLKNGKVLVQSGGGIVADSDPVKEYEETINKAKAVITAIKGEIK